MKEPKPLPPFITDEEKKKRPFAYNEEFTSKEWDKHEENQKRKQLESEIKYKPKLKNGTKKPSGPIRNQPLRRLF